MGLARLASSEGNRHVQTYLRRGIISLLSGNSSNTAIGFIDFAKSRGVESRTLFFRLGALIQSCRGRLDVLNTGGFMQDLVGGIAKFAVPSQWQWGWGGGGEGKLELSQLKTECQVRIHRCHHRYLGIVASGYRCLVVLHAYLCTHCENGGSCT